MITLPHLLSITSTLLLFILVHYLYFKRRAKIAVVLHQLLRVSYLLVIMSGILLLPQMPVTFARLFKLLSGIIVMGFMEIVLMHRVKGDLSKVHWIIFGVVLGLTIVVGLALPLGIALLNF
ncbi:hypothetical protein HNR44_003122 [Geomicrobium halophilum]|uniref:Uncharacterized protein n=1 Tax=Geomicrobium halophilum TaxID=549000 RepID=A0A841Q2Q5_9BACL|nr:DUF1516 family protein [Geomicrobium halophilum]MBB6451128.1 hypothetical protein [Geomicrobium halophilum]